MKKILVVDNDPLFLDFVRDLLQEAGNLVKTAEDGISALKILKTFTPDTIFVDLIMPNIDGKRLCGIIQKMERLKDSSIVILSAAATENLVEVSALGVDGIIAKGPLKNMVRDILEVVDQIKVDAPFSPSKEVSQYRRRLPEGNHQRIAFNEKAFGIGIGPIDRRHP